jgi:hypothetical protein
MISTYFRLKMKRWFLEKSFAFTHTLLGHGQPVSKLFFVYVFILSAAALLLVQSIRGVFTNPHGYKNAARLAEMHDERRTFSLDHTILMLEIDKPNRTFLYNTAATPSCNRSLTLVTAYYDIGRTQRPTETYLTWMKKTLELNAPFVIFTQQKFKSQIEAIIPRNRPVAIIVLEFRDLPYHRDVAGVTKIINSSVYKKKMAAPSRIECTNPLYNVVQYSKLTFLHLASDKNTFGSVQFVWMDAGASRFFGKFDVTRPLSGRKLSTRAFTMVMERRIELMFTSVGYDKLVWNSANYVRGTMMGGGARVGLRRLAFDLWLEWLLMLKNRAVNNEQIALHLLYTRKPELFEPYSFFSIADWENFLFFLV